MPDHRVSKRKGVPNHFEYLETADKDRHEPANILCGKVPWSTTTQEFIAWPNAGNGVCAFIAAACGLNDMGCDVPKRYTYEIVEQELRLDGSEHDHTVYDRLVRLSPVMGEFA